MVFNSIEFAILFIFVFSFYLSTTNFRLQNLILLVASYIFYAYWDYRFLSLLILSTVLDYFLAQAIGKAKDKSSKKLFLICSMVVSLSILGFFKYYNFFIESFSTFMGLFGLPVSIKALNIILPLGISFYTFQTMSYVIDVYRGHLRPAKSLLDFALFVSFFPQLVAGPIERATELLPQVTSPRVMSWRKFKEGCYLFLYGVYMKVFVADNLAKIVDASFANSDSQTGYQMLFALYAFAFQIFCDFGGYSSMARGIAKIMGFELMINFRLPYFTTNPRDFWRNWHISLSTWLRDYVYIPLGGNRGGKAFIARNLMITMFLGGIWHGASWTFILWGIYHGMLLVVFNIFVSPAKKINTPVVENAVKKTLFMIIFFHVVCLGWLLFRAQSVTQAVCILSTIVYNFSFDAAGFWAQGKVFLMYTSFLLIYQFFQARKNDIDVIFTWPAWVRFAVYAFMLYSICAWGSFEGEEFIYFVF